MKKIFLSVLSLIIISICQISYAQGGNIPINLKGKNEIKQEEKAIALTLSLGEFNGAPENAVMGYETVLDYKEDIFTSVTVEGLNGWHAEYNDTTKRLIGDTTSGSLNKDIAKITLTLKEDIEIENKITTTVSLKEGLFSMNDDEQYDTEFEKNIEISILPKDKEQETPEQKEPTEEDKKNEEEKKEEPKEEKNKNNNDSKPTKNEKQNEDKTTASKVLPKTGIKTIAITVVLISIAGIIFLIKYKKIQIK